jgi:hypothetical protein
MVRRVFQLVVVVVLVGLGVMGWRWMFPGDEVRVKRVVEAAVAAVSWEGGEGNIARMAAVNRLGGLCAADVQVVFETRGGRSQVLEGRSDLQQAMMVVRQRAAWLRASVDDLEVRLGDGGLGAVVLLAATVEIGGVDESILGDYKLTLRKEDGEWLIERVEPVGGLGL